MSTTVYDPAWWCYRCMKKFGEEDEDVVDVDEELCDKLTKPKDINYCHVPCTGQCVVTEWSPWTTCPQVRFLQNISTTGYTYSFLLMLFIQHFHIQNVSSAHFIYI